MTDRLDQILDSYDAGMASETAAAAQWNAERSAFLDEFAEVAEGMVVSVLRDIGDRLRSRGHDYELTLEVREQIGGAGEREPARVKLEFYPRAEKPSGFDWRNEISITFFADLHDNSVSVREARLSTGGYVVCSSAAFALANLTAELVRMRCLDVIEEALTPRLA